MKLNRAIFLYLRSNTHLAILAGYILSLIAGVVFARGGAVPAALTVGYLTVAAVVFFSRRGAREIVHEQEEDRNRTNSAKIEKADRMRERISYLRIPDAGVTKAVEGFLLVSGQFLEACRSRDTYLPQGIHEIEKTFDACESFYSFLNDISSSKRYQFEEKETPKPDIEQTKDTTLHLIRSATHRLRQLNRDELHLYTGTEELDTHKDMDEL